MLMRTLIPSLIVALSTLLSGPRAYSQAAAPLDAPILAAPSPGSPTCEEFFDKWEVPGAPPAMLAMAGIGRELMAAIDCIDKNDVRNACAHWSKMLEVTDKLGPPFNQERAGIENQMREHQCDSTHLAPELDPVEE